MDCCGSLTCSPSPHLILRILARDCEFLLYLPEVRLPARLCSFVLTTAQPRLSLAFFIHTRFHLSLHQFVSRSHQPCAAFISLNHPPKAENQPSASQPTTHFLLSTLLQSHQHHIYFENGPRARPVLLETLLESSAPRRRSQKRQHAEPRIAHAIQVPQPSPHRVSDSPANL